MIFVYIFGAVAVVILGFVILVALRPADFRVVRSATMSAPPADVFAQVNDFHKWDAWSPWAKLDPSMKTTYDGQPTGTGASYSWNGNSHVGEGRMTITESRPNDLIRIKLEFRRPFAATNDVEFTFKPEGQQTIVTWSMAGKANFMVRAFSLFMSMDKMVGGMYEQGLSQLSAAASAAAAKQ
jgi:uncharacterized protein YndB with AHSA1/START domain